MNINEATVTDGTSSRGQGAEQQLGEHMDVRSGAVGATSDNGSALQDIMATDSSQ